MSTVTSADGTTIAFTRAGQGPPLILVDGALCSRSFGPMPKLAAQLTPHFTVYTYDRRGRGASGDTPPYAPDREVDDLEALAAMASDQHGGPVFLHGTSSGAALALEAAKRIPAIAKLAVYEPPFIVDGSRSPIPDDYLTELNRLVADGRRGDAVKMFMRFVGTPAIFTAVMPLTPVWPKLKAVAPTLPYDIDDRAGPPARDAARRPRSGPRSRSRRWWRPAARARPGWPTRRAPSPTPCLMRGTGPCPARTTWSSRRPSRPC